MRRLFWVAAGAAAGIWAYQRSGEAIERARDRGTVGNLAAAAGVTTRVAGAATRAVGVAGEQGAKLASKLTTAPAPPATMTTQPEEHPPPHDKPEGRP